MAKLLIKGKGYQIQNFGENIKKKIRSWQTFYKVCTSCWSLFSYKRKDVHFTGYISEGYRVICPHCKTKNWTRWSKY